MHCEGETEQWKSYKINEISKFPKKKHCNYFLLDLHIFSFFFDVFWILFGFWETKVVKRKEKLLIGNTC